MDKPNAFVVGGSSGLGLDLGRLLARDYQVFITGRRNPEVEGISFLPLDLSSDLHVLARNLDDVIAGLPRIEVLVYAAGFRQEGRIDGLTDSDIVAMSSVGLLAPAMLIRRVMKKQDGLAGIIAITSISQWTPKVLEPMYNAVKGGLGMLANSLSLDPRVGKVLVAGPAGMLTKFWAGSSRDTTGMLDPAWVAREILGLYEGEFKYRLARILRKPPRIEVVETR